MMVGAGVRGQGNTAKTSGLGGRRIDDIIYAYQRTFAESNFLEH